MNVNVKRQEPVPVEIPIEKLTIELNAFEANLLIAFLRSTYCESNGSELNYEVDNPRFREEVARNQMLQESMLRPDRELSTRLFYPLLQAIQGPPSKGCNSAALASNGSSV